MFHRALDAKVSFSQSLINKHSALRNPAAPCAKPGMDIVASKKRTIRHSDFVHDTVSRRVSAARRFPANNPPVGLAVVNDQGQILPNGFERA